jgi:hypothetical protein
LYCNAPNCQTGTCVALGMDQGNKSPVCGCDGVTYWNGATAGAHGMSVAHSGACAPSKPCGGPNDTQCDAGLTCNIHLASGADCSTADPSGECWGMPAMCPIAVGFGTNSSTCDPNMAWCADECGVIQLGLPWFSDDTCPL